MYLADLLTIPANMAGLPAISLPCGFDGAGLPIGVQLITGVLQEERLGTLGDHYASPVASGDRVCIVAQSGTAVVLRAGDTLDVLARNPLGDAVVATPAIAHGRIHVRTATRLHAFGPSHGGAR
jgi:hypothetical protein